MIDFSHRYGVYVQFERKELNYRLVKYQIKAKRKIFAGMA